MSDLAGFRRAARWPESDDSGGLSLIAAQGCYNLADFPIVEPFPAVHGLAAKTLHNLILRQRQEPGRDVASRTPQGVRPYG